MSSPSRPNTRSIGGGPINLGLTLITHLVANGVDISFKLLDQVEIKITKTELIPKPLFKIEVMRYTLCNANALFMNNFIADELMYLLQAQKGVRLVRIHS